MADLQDDPAEELRWDERALEAARQQLAAARQAEQALPEDGYERLVRSSSTRSAPS
jgi:hypothetical protein